MKVVQVENYFQPQLGYQETFFDIEFRKCRFESLIITSDRFFPFPDYKDTTQNILGGRIFGIKGHRQIRKMGFNTIHLRTHLENATTGQVLMLGLWNALKKANADIIIAHRMYNLTTIMTYLWAVVKKKRIVIDDHVLVKRKSMFIRVYTSIVELIYRFLPEPTYVFVISEELRKYWSDKKIFKKIDKIPLGADLTTFKPNESMRRKKRIKLGISNESFVLFYAGKVIKKKGLEKLIIFAKKLEIFTKKTIKVVMIGSGVSTYISKLLNQANELKVSLIIIPMVPNVKLSNYMQVADLGCWFGDVPSASIQELAGVGVPTLAKNSLQQGNEISYEILQMCYNPEAVDETAKKLAKIITDDKEYNHIKKKTRIFAENTLSYEKAIQTILKHIKKAH